MKFTAQQRFVHEYAALHADHQAKFRSLIKAFNEACEEYVANPGGYVWPKSLRVRQMTSAPGIWEMTWSFSGPDGRATFRFTKIGDETALEWRRIGRHEIYRNP